MLIRYSVENFKSIRDKVELSMEAVGISELKETLITGKDGDKYLPLAAIYGPNGGGKSNVLQSFYCLWTRIVWPIRNSLEGIGNSVKTIKMKLLVQQRIINVLVVNQREIQIRVKFVKSAVLKSLNLE